MALKDNEFARRHAGETEYRSDALRLSWTFDRLPSADGHLLDFRFACSARIANHPADRQMCAEVFLNGTDALTRDRIVEHFNRALHAALRLLVAECKAADVIGGTHYQKCIQALTTAVQPIAFASGVEFLAPFQLDVESDTLRRDALRESATARQNRQFESAAVTLQRFQALRDAAPDLPIGKLLEQFGHSEQGSLFQTLLMASANSAKPSPLWAVAGPMLVKIDPRAAAARIELFPIATDLGPLRSVQAATIGENRVLLLGAQRGVLVARAENPSDAKLYQLPKLESLLGFNRVLYADGYLWASHAEAGIACWQIDDPSAPPVIYPEEGPRNLQAIGPSRVIYSVQSKLILRHENDRRMVALSSESPIVSIVPISRPMIVAVQEDGTISVLERSTGKIVDTRRRGTPICAAAGLPWMGETRLLLASAQGPIDCIALDDPLITQYLSPYLGLKVVTASHDLIAAVSPDRQRVIVWHIWDGQRPIGEIHITGQTKHRVADVRFEEILH